MSEVSAKQQITVPVDPCREAGIGVGDHFRAGLRRSWARLVPIPLCLVAIPGFGESDDGHDDDARPRIHEEIIVYGRAQHHIGTATSAAEGVVGYADYHLPPLLRVGELVEAVPGMVATQHSGTGKANQYFLRGFNLDHGTDFAAHLNGVPLNMRSHGHGQGYLDLNFIIPELVQTAVYRKGVHHAEKGDFSSAGSVDFSYYERLPAPFVQLTMGEHGYVRGVLAGSVDVGGGELTGAVAKTGYEGPWLLDEDLAQSKIYLGYGFSIGPARGQIALHGYAGRWKATDQIPRRAVRAGLVSRTGYVDPDLGGDTDRVGVAARLEGDRWRAGAYRLDYDFSLFSNFTYQLDDPELGDEFEQRDDRTLSGAWFAGERNTSLAGLPALLRWGVEARRDDIHEVGLFGTQARVRNQVRRHDRVDETSIGAYGELGVHATDRIRATLGLRADHYDWEVTGLAEAYRAVGEDSLACPKVSLAYRILDGLEAYANWGRGFHSNDARVGPDGNGTAAKGGSDLLSRSEGAEFGLRFEPHASFNATLVGFHLRLDSELVYVGDAGSTEPSDGSKRRGLEIAGFWQARDWLAVNAAYTWSRAELDTGDEVAGAVGITGNVGVNALFGQGFHASLNVRFLGEAPLSDDGSVRSEPFWLSHVGIGWQIGRTDIGLDVFNLFDSSDDDIAYYYHSRLPGEPVQGVLDTHFHPLEPRTVRARVAVHL